MFSLFKKEPSTSYPTREKVWKTGEAARKGLLTMAMMRLQQNQPALVFTFFDEEKLQLASFLKENDINHVELSEPESVHAPSRAIYFATAHELQAGTVANWLIKNSILLGKSVLFPCHYPMMAEENKILGQLAGFGFLDFIFCLSFDDPMMESFKKNIVPLMEKLGLEENESIEHGMVTNAIKNMRKKINEKVKLEKKAQSAAEWYALNIKA